MALYQVYIDGHVLRDDGLIIPPDPNNLDWQGYQTWSAVSGNIVDPAPTPAPQTEISAAEFLARLTDTERLALQTAADAHPSIALGLTMGLATGTIRLAGDAAVSAWMAALVTAGALTADRKTQILTPQ